MAYFNILRNRSNKFLGFNVDGFTVKSWEELERLAQSRIDKHDPDWSEIEITGDQLETESIKISVDLSLQLAKENEALAKQNLELLSQKARQEETICRLKSDFDNLKKDSERSHRVLKAEVITSLRAINLCLLASITTSRQVLTHRQRNFRMSHVNQIISNEIGRFSGFKLESYEDDF